ncbi:MAG: hypothetical protein IJ228_00775 [Succinivibrio sp.]|nr:hypothetical protein [Succinivibrio sp.]
MSFQQFRELVLQLTGVIVTPYEGLLPESMAGYAISMSMADKSELSKDALRKQLMQAKKRTSQKASKGGVAGSAHAFNESEVYRALLSAGFTTAEIENKKRRGGMLIPAVMKFYGRQGWRLGRTAITFEVLTLKLKNVWLPREREKDPRRRYSSGKAA